MVFDVMRFGIISDIHSNYEALKATCKELKARGCDKLICLGDVVGYGPSPRECIDFIRENEIESIKGNHDYYVCRESNEIDSLEISEAAFVAMQWTRDELGDDHSSWLEELPFSLNYDDVTFIHAAVDTADGEYWPYISDVQAAMFHFYLQDTKFAFFGHIHVPLLFAYHCDDAHPTIWVEKLKNRSFSDCPDHKFLINPGSVGQPRNADTRSSAAIFDSDTHDLELLAVDYDIDSTSRKIIDAGLPHELAHRLTKGY